MCGCRADDLGAIEGLTGPCTVLDGMDRFCEIYSQFHAYLSTLEYDITKISSGEIKVALSMFHMGSHSGGGGDVHLLP